MRAFEAWKMFEVLEYLLLWLPFWLVHFGAEGSKSSVRILAQKLRLAGGYRVLATEHLKAQHESTPLRLRGSLNDGRGMFVSFIEGL